MRRIIVGLAIVASLALAGGLSACGTTQEALASPDLHQNVLKGLIAANDTLATVETGVVAAVQAGAIKPNSDTAIAIHKGLVVVRKGLDAAGTAWRANMDDLAKVQLDGANATLTQIQTDTSAAAAPPDPPQP